MRPDQRGGERCRSNAPAISLLAPPRVHELARGQVQQEHRCSAGAGEHHAVGAPVRQDGHPVRGPLHRAAGAGRRRRRRRPAGPERRRPAWAASKPGDDVVRAAQVVRVREGVVEETRAASRPSAGRAASGGQPAPDDRGRGRSSAHEAAAEAQEARVVRGGKDGPLLGWSRGSADSTRGGPGRKPCSQRRGAGGHAHRSTSPHRRTPHATWSTRPRGCPARTIYGALRAEGRTVAMVVNENERRRGPGRRRRGSRVGAAAPTPQARVGHETAGRSSGGWPTPWPSAGRPPAPSARGCSGRSSTTSSDSAPEKSLGGDSVAHPPPWRRPA